MKVMMFCTDRHGAISALKYMLCCGLHIVGCVFDEERPNDLSKLCEEESIPCYTTEKLYEDLELGKLPEFDLGISYLYHRLIKENVINRASYGIINFHPAPVSVHKGVAACCYCLLNEFEEWAVTAHYVSPRIDEGDVIEERWFKMTENHWGGVPTAVSAERYIQIQSLKLFRDIIDLIVKKRPLPRKQQDLSKGVYFSKKDLETIKNVSGITDAKEINRRICSLWMPPYHGAYVVIDGEKYTLVNEDILKELATLYNKQ